MRPSAEGYSQPEENRASGEPRQVKLGTRDELVSTLPADAIQRFLRARKSLGHRKSGAIFLSGGLLVALLFERGAQQIVGLESRRFFHRCARGEITAQELDGAREIAASATQRFR